MGILNGATELIRIMMLKQNPHRKSVSHKDNEYLLWVRRSPWAFSHIVRLAGVRMNLNHFPDADKVFRDSHSERKYLIEPTNFPHRTGKSTKQFDRKRLEKIPALSSFHWLTST